MRFKPWLPIFMALLFCPLRGFTQPVNLTFDTIKQLVEQKNLKVQSLHFAKQASMAKQFSVISSFMPQAEVFFAQETFQLGQEESQIQPTYGFEIKVNLFNAGIDVLESEHRSLLVQKKSYEYERAVAEEVKAARELFWQVLFVQHKLKLHESMTNINQKNFQAAEQRIRSGVASASDRVEFEMKALELKQDIEQDRFYLASLQRELFVLLGGEQDQQYVFPETLEHTHNYAQLVQHEHQDHEFLYKEFELEAQALDLASTAQKRQWWPKMDIYASFHQLNEREEELPQAQDRTESIIGIRVSMSLFDGGERTREAMSLRQQSLGLKKQGEYTKSQVHAHLTNETQELDVLHKLVHDAQKNIELAERYYRLTQADYARGVKNSPDVLGATDKLFATRLKHLEIIRDFQLAKTHLLAKMGNR